MAETIQNHSFADPHKPVILIIDDTPVNLKVVTDALNTHGYKTFIATDGLIGLERAKRIRPDLILLDVMMPNIDGFDVCHRLKSDHDVKDIPVIFMTVLDSVEHKLRGFLEGAVDYVTKPIQHEELLARVSTHIRLRHLMQQFQQQASELADANAEIVALNDQLKQENIRVSDDLRATQHKFQTLAEEISDGYFVLEDSRILFANQAFGRMHGYASCENLIGKSFLEFVAPESREDVKALYERVRQDLTLSHLFEYQRLMSDGTRHPTELTAKTTWYDRSMLDIGICRDITERIAMEQRLLESERLAYVGNITTSLSHELRNPLSAVKMTLQLLQRNSQLAETDQHRIKVAVREMANLEHILQELLDFAKPQYLNIGPCDLADIVTDCLEIFAVKLEAKHLTINHRFAEDLPSIRADKDKLTQVIINLLLNALDASNEGGTIRIICLRSEVLKGCPGVEIVIEDEGTGILPEHMPKIFTPFFTTKSRGTGLGLANAKHIVTAHGGYIEATNRSPHGARLRIWLPEE